MSHLSPEHRAPASRPNAQLMIEGAVGQLLPHAVHNVGLPHQTPLRWHESRMEGDNEPFSVGLWVNFDSRMARRLAINRRLPADREDLDRLWICSLTEPTPREDHEATYSTTKIAVSTAGKVSVESVRFKKSPENPDHPGTCVGGEWDYGLSRERKTELLSQMAEVLTLAAVQIPADQRSFLALEGIDSSGRSFVELGSAASKSALGHLMQPVV